MSDESPFVPTFFTELKRRKVFRVAGVYAIVAWLIIQIGESTFEALHLPPWALTFIIILLFAGFPIAIIFAWIFDRSPEGKIQRDKLDQNLRPVIKKKRTWFAIGGIIAGIILGIFIARLYTPLTTDDNGVNNKSVAVLPFTSFSDEKDDSYFADGVHDDILTQLSKIKDIKVISRTSVVQYKNTTKTMNEIAKELNVRHILEGSVRRAGNQIRIVAQLINADADNHIWSETYDREYADIFAIQSDVAKQIAAALKATLTPKETNYLDEKPTNNLEAWDLYLKANILLKNGKTSRDSIIALYDQAVALDPNFLQAYGQIAFLNAAAYLNGQGRDPSPSRLTMAQEAIAKAQTINPIHPDYHDAQGRVYYYGTRDYTKALSEYYKALASKPNNADILGHIGYVLRRQGKWEESLTFLKKAHELDPNSMNAINNYLISLYCMRRWDEYERIGNRRLVLAPDDLEIKEAHLTNNYIITGNLNVYNRQALEIINKYGPEESLGLRTNVAWYNRDFAEHVKTLMEYPTEWRNMSYYMALGYAYSRLGDTEMLYACADTIMNFALKTLDINPNNARAHMDLAIAYSVFGDSTNTSKEVDLAERNLPVSDDALSGATILQLKRNLYLHINNNEKALEAIQYLLSIPSYVNIRELRIDPIYDGLRDDPRFQKLIAED